MKQKTFREIFRLIYLLIAGVGCLCSFGLFGAWHNDSFYIFYTNLSNYICWLFILAALLFDFFHKDADSFAPRLQFYCVIMILVTCLVANILLENIFTPKYWLNFNPHQFIVHVAAPILFFLDWLLFGKRDALHAVDPLLGTVFPLVYVNIILVRGAFLPADSALLRYPYFFLEADKIGYFAVSVWVAVLLLVFIVIGYLLLLLDRRLKK